MNEKQMYTSFVWSYVGAAETGKELRDLALSPLN